MRKISLARTLCLFAGAAALQAEIKVPNLFSDNMVIQRDTAVPVWGWAMPGEKVTVKFRGQEKSTAADLSGKWTVKLAPLRACSTPETMEISAGADTKAIKNILTGDVWLCSGQSNMEMALASCENAKEEISAANYPEIREFRARNTPDTEKAAEDVNGKWVVCSPRSAGEFSGAAFFFARELYKKIKTPVGLINNSVGATAAETWMSPASLKREPVFKPVLDRYEEALKVYPEKQAEYDRAVRPWNELTGQKDIRRKFTDTEKTGEKNSWASPDFDDSGWRKTPAGISKIWKAPSVMWFRNRFVIPPEWEGKDITVDGLFVAIRFYGAYTVCFNGEKISGDEAEGWHDIRLTIPGSMVKAGEAVLTTRILSSQSTGRFCGYYKVAPANYAEVILSEDQFSAGINPANFRVRACYKAAAPAGGEDIPVVTHPGVQPVGPRHPNAPSALYNALVCPLAPFAVRGVLWYQGEGNAQRACQYRKTLPALIHSWRELWGSDIPFIIVQLANYKWRVEEPSESVWAELREAQSMTANQESGCALAVAIDIGDAVDVHPKNKRTLGARLALAALKLAYGEDVVASGPVFKSVKFENGKAVLTFGNIGGGLVAKGGAPLKGFAIAGDDRKFSWADAVINADTVIVSSSNVPLPAAVRYAWADNPDCGLYNQNGLPAVPFRTDRWPEVTKDKN
jgi:sialate O-acetylesterase